MKKLQGIKKWLVTDKKRLIGAVFIFLLIVFAGYRIFSSKNNQPTYQTATVEKGTIIASISASGNVIQSNITNVTSQASGVVTEVYVEEGTTVVKGTKIAQITLDQEGQQAATSAYASYLSAKNALDSANSALFSLDSSMWSANQKFINDAVERGLATDDPTYIQENDDWQSAQAKYLQGKNAITLAQANLSNASVNLSQTQGIIYAPVAGTIKGLTIAKGMTFGSSTTTSGSRNSQRIASIAQTGNILVSVNISEIDVPNIKVGQNATVTFDSIPEKTFSGKVVSIDRIGSTTSGVTNYPAIIALDTSSDSILTNMASTANIITDIKDNVLFIPSTSIKQQAGESVVTVLTDKKTTQLVTVETGIFSDSDTEIVSGLDEGQTIVTSTSTTSTSQQGSSVFGGGFGSGRAVFGR